MTTQSVLITGWGCPARLLEPLAAAIREDQAGAVTDSSTARSVSSPYLPDSATDPAYPANLRTSEGGPLLIDFHHLLLGSDEFAARSACHAETERRRVSSPYLSERQSKAEGRPDYVEGVRRSLADVECPLMLIGWSTGALIALEFAIRHPDQVAQLLLMSATARFTTATDYPAGVPMEQVDSLAAAIQSDEDRERALTRFMAQSALPQRLERITLRERVEAALSLEPEALLAGLQYLRSTDVRNSVETIRCPARIWHGAADAVIPVAAAEWLARRLPTADLHIEPQAGHDWPVQNPDALAQWMQ